MRKFELTNEFRRTKIFGNKVYRIKALIDFGAVKAGDLGGYIEKEENLSQDGNAWVCGEAQVCGKTRVNGFTHVYEEFEVHENVEVKCECFCARRCACVQRCSGVGSGIQLNKKR